MRLLFVATFLAVNLSLSLATWADHAQLTRDDVERVLAQAATEASRINPKAIIAVTDREGFLLGVWDMNGRLPDPIPALNLADPNSIKTYGLLAGPVTRASTAAFLSSDQNAFTTRTAGFIIQQHFPPGVRNAGPGPLVGVGLSSLFYSDVNRVKLIPPDFDGSAPVPPNVSPGVRAPLLPLTSLNDSPGGVPLYKNDRLVGGVGVVGDRSPTDLAPAGAIFFEDNRKDATTGFKTGDDLDEFVALAGQTGFRPDEDILATRVLINGIRVPYVHPREEDIKNVDDVKPLGTFGRGVRIPVNVFAGGPPFTGNEPQASPAPYPYEETSRFGEFEGEVRFPTRDDPLISHPTRSRIRGVKRLTRDDVEEILSDAAKRAKITRAGIRLPLGTNAKTFIVVVNNPHKAGEEPQILGIFRTGEATIFSWDVAAQKARTALFFSNAQLAMSTRSVGFLAQRFYPPGLDRTTHGPLFGFQEAVSLRFHPRFDASTFDPSMPPSRTNKPPFPGNTNLPNGMTIFPGGFPLYRDGVLVGAVGVSGDGVDQDDIIAASGCQDFLADKELRADQFTYRGARLPYAKFPRDPVK